MERLKSFKGYKISQMPSDLPTYSKIVGDALASAQNSFLWFEGKMAVRTSEYALDNIALLYTGEMTPARYMAVLQESL
jgi:raffinose/stachyose/melibiose transport system substrate-binding protein